MALQPRLKDRRNHKISFDPEHPSNKPQKMGKPPKPRSGFKPIPPHSVASMTEQAHHDDVKIQNILRKHKQTGIVTHTAKYEGKYMDMVGFPEFQEAQNMIAATKSMFETIPAQIRLDFDNDPGKFVEFMQNDDNREAIAEYGFDTSHLTPLPEAPAAPVDVNIVNPDPDPPPAP